MYLKSTLAKDAKTIAIVTAKVTDHKITSANIIIMKNMAIVQELPKCDPEKGSKQLLLEKMAPIVLLHTGLPHTSSLQHTWVYKA